MKFSHVGRLLSEIYLGFRLMKNSVDFRWGPKQQIMFETLRKRLCEAHVLILLEFVSDFMV